MNASIRRSPLLHAAALALAWAPAALRVGPAALGLGAFALPRLAEAGPAVTVYTRDLAYVRETRTLEVRAPRDTVLIPDVPERIDFASARLAPADRSRVIRLAYRFDVASGDGMLERARGGRVRVALRDQRSVEGVLLAVDGAWLVVREDGGAVHTLARHAADDVRILGLTVTPALRPSLEAVIEAERRGRIEAELSYLTGGLSWSAEHTLVRTAENRVTWSADVTVENSSGRDYVDARLKLVAGEPARVTPPPIPFDRRAAMALEASMAEKGADLVEQTFSEYHLYTLERPATLRDRESQKLGMLEPRPVSVTPRYLYRGGDPRGVRAQIEVRNTRENGLGVPLPGGRVRVYEPDPDGAVQFVGESILRHTPESERLTLEVGSAFDLAAERREVSQRRIGDREREYTVEIKLRNRKKTPVTIVVEEGVHGEVDISQPSHPVTRKDANTLQFTVAVAPGREETIRYTARVRY